MPDVGIGSILGAGASLAGGLIGANAASEAASAQAAGTAQAAQAAQAAQLAAIAEQRRQYDQTRADLGPWRDVGGGAILRLGDLMGVPRAAPQAQQTQAVAPTAPTREQFTKAGPMVRVPTQGTFFGTDEMGSPIYMRSGADYIEVPGPSVFDEAAYNAAMEKYNSDLAAYSAARSSAAAMPAAAAADTQAAPPPADFGALTKKFTVGDFWSDPVTQLSLQYGLDTGTKALNNQAASRGMLNSGAQLKALTRFGTDYVGQQAAGAQARFVGDQTNLYNRLAGLAGSGQQAVNTGASSGANAANSIGSIYTGTANTLGNLYSGLGNARGAAAIAGGNALGGALGQIGSYYGQQQTLDRILNRSSAPAYTGYGIQGDYQYG